MSETVHDVELFGHWICPFSVRVSFALAVRSIAHRVVEVPPSAVRPKGFVVPEAFTLHSPRLEIPLLRIDQTYLADSIPILEWLDAVFPGTWESSEVVAQRCQWIDAKLFRPMISIYYGTSPNEIRVASETLDQRLNELGELLGHNEWLVGSGPSRAEAVLAPLYVRLHGLSQLGWTGTLPKVVALHAQRTMSLAGAASVEWTSAQTEEFVARFLAYRRKMSAGISR